jgi:hypothetical protein
MINGFSDKHHEFTSRVTRIMNEDACFPCWTNRNFVFNPEIGIGALFIKGLKNNIFVKNQLHPPKCLK